MDLFKRCRRVIWKLIIVMTLGSVLVAPLKTQAAGFPIELKIDDGQAEAAFGIGGASARQFLWFNQFANPGDFRLEEIQVLFPNGADVPLGGAIELAVFLDPDGDPTNGAELLANYDRTIQAKDGNTFSIYPIDPPLLITQEGDILIGVISRYIVSGVSPPTNPAALDTTSSQGRAWVVNWTGDPPDPPSLPSDEALYQLAGNFMIRGYGSPWASKVEPVPSLGGSGLAILAISLGIVALRFLRQRKSTMTDT
jgi:hypothetical protein